MNGPKREYVEILGESIGEYGYSPQIVRAIKSFLCSPYGSLIVVNKQGMIEYMDNRSEKFFGLAHGSSKGLPITDIIPRSHFPKVLEKGLPEIGKVLFLGKKQSVGTIVPLIEKGEVIGAMGYVVFDSPEEVFRINREIEGLTKSPSLSTPSRCDGSETRYSFEDILGVSKAIRDAIHVAKRIAALDLNVLIMGETGTGKELFAQSIHRYARPDRPFVRVNSPSIPAELAESELFGYEKGAFSGARSSGKPGKFELAEKGSIFIDEISSMPLPLQGKLLWVLQEREFERVGGTEVRTLEARVLSATNINLTDLVEQGSFREDLYYRISGLMLRIPPLKERREDVPVYLDHYIKECNGLFGTVFERLSGEALSWCMQYEWPGNVRELKSSIEHAVLTKWHGKEIPLECFPQKSACCNSAGTPHGASSRDEEKRLIIDALRGNGGNKRRAAQALGISRATLYKKMADHRITI